MNRRNFMRTLLGVASATALPSEVWPFRKIFLPPAPSIVTAIDAEAWPGMLYPMYATYLAAMYDQNPRAQFKLLNVVPPKWKEPRIVLA